MVWIIHIKTHYRQLLVPLMATIVFVIFMVPGRNFQGSNRSFLLLYGDIILPPLVGWLACGLLLGDPCREWLFTWPRPAWKSVLERYLLLLSISIAAWILFVVTTLFLTEDSLINPLNVTLAVVVTIFAFSSLGLWSALQTKGLLRGQVVVAAYWSMSLICRRLLLEHPIGHLIYPFLTYEMIESPLLFANRVFLCAAGIMLVLVSRYLLNNEEAFLWRNSNEEV